MGLFSKKHKSDELVAPVNGKLIPLEKVDDQVFSQKMMGDGFAVEPSDGNIVSPVSGKVESVFPTKHALMISTKNGLEIMLHLGLDTVELNGKPFEITVNEGDSIESGQSLGNMDLDEIVNSGKKTTVIAIVSNMDSVSKMSPVDTKTVNSGDKVQTATL
ncbi:PTS sugar transporter subunit IIA [Companilactobacillus mishanensis]|uniref:PTS sugar transporter subunit IIA n=1 Tax=Companilactobacillus mishanensis TaxID=2486008 RepID=UPI001297FBF3|nr:PTS glucose transporter subunit IIA [Companilactobacillus mishanensis]MQS88504.1 PTS glucose transporter subunit IIA [Companilactobacillus mishanensis]